jgi:hypothetical protein
VKQVYLVDAKRPESFDLIFKAVIEVAPWVAEKVQFNQHCISTRPLIV